MRLLEHQSKALLSRFGLNFTACTVCTSAQEAEHAAIALGNTSAVVKAQVPFGGRGKAGAVIFAEDAVSVRQAAAKLLAMELRRHPVNAVSVEEKVMVVREFYAGIAWDSGAKLPVAILSSTGGIDVEHSQETVRRTFDPFTGLRAYEGREMARKLGLDGTKMINLGSALAILANAFLELDGVTIEINPLALITDGTFIGLDAHVELDDDAAARLARKLADLGPIESGAAGRPPTALEKEAHRIDTADHRGVAGRVVEFDGNLALLIGGGGASLTVFDAVRPLRRKTRQLLRGRRQSDRGKSGGTHVAAAEQARREKNRSHYERCGGTTRARM